MDFCFRSGQLMTQFFFFFILFSFLVSFRLSFPKQAPIVTMILSRRFGPLSKVQCESKPNEGVKFFSTSCPIEPSPPDYPGVKDPHHIQSAEMQPWGCQTRHPSLLYNALRSCPWTPQTRSMTKGQPYLSPTCTVKFKFVRILLWLYRDGIACKSEGLTKLHTSTAPLQSHKPSPSPQNVCRLDGQTPMNP